jgi:hypothetical protein
MIKASIMECAEKPTLKALLPCLKHIFFAMAEYPNLHSSLQGLLQLLTQLLGAILRTLETLAKRLTDSHGATLPDDRKPLVFLYMRA